jgi:hypothetical protein
MLMELTGHSGVGLSVRLSSGFRRLDFVDPANPFEQALRDYSTGRGAHAPQ